MRQLTVNELQNVNGGKTFVRVEIVDASEVEDDGDVAVVKEFISFDKNVLADDQIKFVNLIRRNITKVLDKENDFKIIVKVYR